MKKKLLVLVCACVLALALPVIAFAAPSGAVDGDTTTSTSVDEQGNTSDSLKFTAEGADWVKIEDSGIPAYNAYEFIDEHMEKGDIVASHMYRITASKEDVKVTLVYTTDPSNAGLTCYVFVEHESDSSFEEFVLPVASDGSVTVNMDKLSYVNFFITNQKYESNTTPAAAAVTDTKATSPQTGVVA